MTEEVRNENITLPRDVAVLESKDRGAVEIDYSHRKARTRFIFSKNTSPYPLLPDHSSVGVGFLNSKPTAIFEFLPRYKTKPKSGIAHCRCAHGFDLGADRVWKGNKIHADDTGVFSTNRDTQLRHSGHVHLMAQLPIRSAERRNCRPRTSCLFSSSHARTGSSATAFSSGTVWFSHSISPHLNRSKHCTLIAAELHEVDGGKN